MKIAQAFEVSLNDLAREGINASFDKRTVKYLQQIEGTMENDKSHLLAIVDAFLRDANNRYIEILQALAADTNPVTGEVFPADSQYNQPGTIRALFFVINDLEALAEKGKKGLAWSEGEDEALAQRFTEGTKITEHQIAFQGLWIN